ncbi:thioredoxin-disulfide reductase [Anaerosporomusa subterranea]|uniref:Thioredoxin-disulfide reductase n=1 Tax=Anaerosporomusa subterranea TaxID=1794912 RepID=A0A154BSF6_ANASB|nr:FAD-dependent oxidoreductase [Anaerosporomusa subterranea]KYZ76933.1 thioredoxin-disulfide reductase [Anaerosporomusa subterranea]
MFDLLVIGGGPAGMTAVVYAARKKLNTLLVTQDLGGQVLWTRDIQNYMGYQFVTGPELMAKFEEQVRMFPVTVKYEDVVKLEKMSDGSFTVRTAEGAEYQGKAVILASGKRPRRLNVPGETELTGMGVSYCATCDGPLFAGMSVAVVGSGNSALQAAIELANVAKQVYLVSRDPYIADPIIIEMLEKYPNLEEIKEHESKEIIGKYSVEQYIIHPNGRPEQSRELSVQGVFVEVGLIPNSEFADLVERNEFGEVIVDCRARTNIEGLFAAGDVTDGPDKQIVIAAGDGSKAALVAYEYLLHQR